MILPKLGGHAGSACRALLSATRMPAGLLLAVLGLLTGLARAQSPTVPSAYFFYSSGQKQSLALSTRWLAVQLAPGADVAAVGRRVRAQAGLADTGPAVRYAKENVLIFPAGAGGRNAAQAATLSAVPGVRRAVRVFGNANLPIVETDEFLIQFKGGVSQARAAALLAPYGAVLVRPLGGYAPNGFLARVGDPSSHSAMGAANALYGRPEVQFSLPNFVWPKETRFTPDDPLYKNQWHLRNSGQNGGKLGADISAEAAWDITRGDRNIVIAISDDGVDLNHEDFAGKLVPGFDFVDGDNDPSPVDNPNSNPPEHDNHGTAVAGVAAAQGDNGVGVTGSAPECRIMPIRLIGPGETLQDEADSFHFAADNGADVINASWGPVNDGTPQALPDSTKAAIDYAVTSGRQGRGCVIFFAAGNGDQSVDLDGYASYKNVIAVGASTNQDVRATYSDFGNSLDLCAPSNGGTLAITTTDRSGAAGYDASNYTTTFGGTSSAAPLAAGVGALLLSVDPTLTFQQVRQRLISAADKIDPANANYDSTGHSTLYGYGRLNANAALLASGGGNFITLIAPADNASVAGDVALRASTVRNGGVGRVDFSARQVLADTTHNPNLPINDNSTVSDSIQVAAAGTAAEIEVDVNITHQYVGDLTITLIDPKGTRHVLQDHQGGSGQSINKTFTVAAAGIASKGAWTLEVNDDTPQDTGTFVSWGLHLHSAFAAIARDSDGVDANNEWTATWNTGSLAPGVFDVEATAVTSTGDFDDTNVNISVNGGVIGNPTGTPTPTPTPLPAHLVSGRVVTASGVGVRNAKISISRLNLSVLTNTTGHYSFKDVPRGNYVLTPTMAQTYFLPDSQDISVRSEDLVPPDFVVGGTDQAAPTVSVRDPKLSAAYNQLPQASGQATDQGGARLRKVTIRLFRFATTQHGAGYWGGPSGWQASYTADLNERLATLATPDSNSSSWSYPLPILQEGQYSIRATATDYAYNATASAVVSFFIDKSAPTITVTAPEANQAYRTLAKAFGTAADVGAAGIARVTVRLRRPATSSTAAAFWTGSLSNPQFTAPYDSAVHERPATGTTSWSLQLPALASGAYSVRVTATDRAGNVTVSSEVPFRIDVDNPAIAVTQPQPGGSYASLTAATGTASDAGGSGLSTVRGTLYRFATASHGTGYWAGGTRWTTDFTAASNELLAIGTAQWSLALPSLSTGQYFFRATVEDKAGNRTTTANINFAITTKVAVVSTGFSSASATSQTVRLQFSGPLDSATASDAAHYSLAANGSAVAAEAATYHAGSNSVTLALPAGAAPAGSSVEASWSGLTDAAGRIVAAGSTTVVVR